MGGTDLEEGLLVASGGEVGHTIPMQRVEAFLGLAARRGWDVNALLAKAGVPMSLLGEQRARVTNEQVNALVGELWRTTDDELLGLGTAPVPPGTFRMLASAVLFESGDLGQALRTIGDYERAVPGVPNIRLLVDGAEATLAIHISGTTGPLDLAVDALLAATHRTLGWATGRRIMLRRVLVPQPPPSRTDDYGLIFGAPVEFSSPTPALVFDTSVLSAPIAREPKELEQFLRNAPALLLSRRDFGAPTTDAVRQILRRDGLSRRYTADDVAALLVTSPQTLRRRLRAEDTSLTQIRDDILRDAAIASLATGRETIAALSDRLGFSEPSAFTRAFRRWTGNAPGSYRVTHS